MKKEVHPEYVVSEISCACGNVINTRSTNKKMHVNLCSACHPFFTGTAKMLDAEGRVDRFRKRYGK
jgi:large subunit ribosomal protein L31